VTRTTIAQPLHEARGRLDPVEPEDARARRLVVVCSHGFSSSLAAATLQGLGFSRATDLVGGFVAWKERGLPVSPAPPTDSDTLPGMGQPDP
jgi:rhodanese-related sulfurtransferase